MAIAGKIGNVAKNTEKLAKNAEKNIDQIANSMDEVKCLWFTTSINCIANTQTGRREPGRTRYSKMVLPAGPID